MKKHIPQFEFGFSAEVFSLAGETAPSTTQCAACGWHFLAGADETVCPQCRREFAKRPDERQMTILGGLQPVNL